MSDPIAHLRESGQPEAAPEPPAEPGFWRRVLRRIAGHFAAHRQRSGRAFFWRLTLECLVVSVALAIAVEAISPQDDDFADLSATELIVLGCLAAPICETLLQILPGEIVRLLRQRFWVQVLVVTVPFAALHFTNSFWSGIGAGVIGGFYLAITYVHYREKSLWLAVALTVASHAFQNAVVIALYLLERYFDSLKAISQ